MKDTSKTKKQLISELQDIRRTLSDYTESASSSASTADLLTFAEQLPIGVLQLDGEGNCIYLNNTLRGWLNLETDQATAETPALPDKLATALQSRLRTGLSGQSTAFEVSLETSQTDAEGATTDFSHTTPCWLHIDMHPYADGVWCIMQDTTFRKLYETEIQHYKAHLEDMVEERTRELEKVLLQYKRTAKKLEAQDIFLTTIFNQINVCIRIAKINHDKECLWQYNNPADKELTGLDLNSPDGVRIEDLGSAEQVQIYRAKCQELEQTRTPLSFEEKYVINGEEKWLFVTLIPIFDGHDNISQVLFSGIHITDRKEAEQALQASEARYRSVVTAMTEGIVFQDADGKILACNPSAEQILGITQSGLMGQTSKDREPYCLREDGSVFEAEDHPAMVTLRTGQAQRNVIMGIKHPDESIRWISINSQPLFHETKSKPQAVITSFSDITERRKNEIELRKYRHHLEDVVRERTNEIRQVNARLTREINERKQMEKALRLSEKQLKALNATKDKFLNIIAHDLKNPLHSLHLGTELLSHNIEELSQKDIQFYATGLHEKVDNLHRLIENLLQWARTQTGKIHFKPDHIELLVVTESAIEALRPVAKDKGIEIINKISMEAMAYADYQMIGTVVRNLVSNAIKFSYPDSDIVISCKEQPAFVEVAVSDAGVGISASMMSQLFRIDVSVTDKGTANEEGTGLGLILCKEFVERNSGTIRIQSLPGRGTTVLFTLPRKPIRSLQSAAAGLSA